MICQNKEKEETILHLQCQFPCFRYIRIRQFDRPELNCFDNLCEIELRSIFFLAGNPNGCINHTMNDALLLKTTQALTLGYVLGYHTGTAGRSQVSYPLDDCPLNRTWTYLFSNFFKNFVYKQLIKIKQKHVNMKANYFIDYFGPLRLQLTLL